MKMSLRFKLGPNQIFLGFWVLVFITLFPFVSYGKSGLQFNGSMYSDLGWSHYYKSSTSDSVSFCGVSVLGVGFKNSNRKYAKVEGILDILLPHGHYAKSWSQGMSSFLAPMADSLIGSPLLPFIMDLRKLYVSMYLPWADITLGRQVVNFGKGVLFSPVDVFSSVELADLNYRRRGADIISARFPLGNLSGLDVIAQLPQGAGAHSNALRAFTTKWDFDLAAVGIYRHGAAGDTVGDKVLGGLSFKGDMKAGLTGETVIHYTTKGGSTYGEVMAGADYSWGQKWFVSGEYLYRDTGLVHPLWGVHNVYGSIRYMINDLMHVSLSLIHVISTPSSIGMVQYFYNILQNVNATVYCRAFDGLSTPNLEYAGRVEVKF